ncbi:MAG TPA: hypothetical protein VG223_17275 [Solirubrobacteraceae bacterium]|jgi:hypothetical protein|nr:hypothetical protein [Solirubrobacteraceae bacterium]
MPRRHQILLPFVALIALIAGGVGAIALTTEPRTGALSERISALQGELASSHRQLTTLQHAVAGTPSSAEVKDLAKAVDGLKRTVGGVQGGEVPLQAKVNALTVCIPQLQQELTGAVTSGTAPKGKLVTATVSLSPGCAALFGVG